MKIKYIDYSAKEIKEFECVQVIFTLDKDNVICFKTIDESLNNVIKIPKQDVQTIES